MRNLVVLTALFLSPLSLALTIGEALPAAELSGDNGGRLDGTAWRSDEVKGKVTVIFYVDPDHKDRNNDFSDALKAQGFNRDEFQSVAIINMKATWLPNFAIRSSLRKKQKKFPDTLYLKDKNKVLVEKWGVADEESDIVVTDAQGKVLYFHYGKLEEADIEEAISVINSALPQKSE